MAIPAEKKRYTLADVLTWTEKPSRPRLRTCTASSAVPARPDASLSAHGEGPCINAAQSTMQEAHTNQGGWQPYYTGLPLEWVLWAFHFSLMFFPFILSGPIG